MMRMLLRLLTCSIVLLLFSCEEKKPSDRMVNVEGQKQHILDLGDGAPVVIFISGLGEDLSSFAGVQTKVATVSKAIAYDRAGLGTSEALDSVRTLDREANELDQVLESEHVRKPYILVGDAMGSLIARYYANLFKHNVAGLVLVDPIHEELLPTIRQMTRPAKEIRTIDSLQHYITPASLPGVKREWHYADANFRLMRGIHLPANIPVTVIASSVWNKEVEKETGLTQSDVALRVSLIRDWIKAAPQAKVVITDKSATKIYQQDAAAVSQEIMLMIDAVRSKK
jgi:pimeloyl-ACP methyl ester carboxylesterase